MADILITLLLFNPHRTGGRQQSQNLCFGPCSVLTHTLMGQEGWGEELTLHNWERSPTENCGKEYVWNNLGEEGK